MNAEELLKSLNACDEACIFAKGKTIKEAWETCYRGDWMLWFFAKVFPEKLKELVMAKAVCVNTIRDLMRDERSIKAIDIAIEFGKELATIEDLKKANLDADNVVNGSNATIADIVVASFDSNPAYAAAITVAASCAVAASFVGDTAASAASAASYVATAISFISSDIEMIKNRQQTSDICREYLDISCLYE